MLVVSDMLAMSTMKMPRFVREYAQLGTAITKAVNNYVADVKSGEFPNENEQY